MEYGITTTNQSSVIKRLLMEQLNLIENEDFSLLNINVEQSEGARGIK
jgi:hypothetical protein